MRISPHASTARRRARARGSKMNEADQITHNRELDLSCAAAWQCEAAADYAEAAELRARGFVRAAAFRQHVARQSYEHSARIMLTILSTDAKFAALRAALG